MSTVQAKRVPIEVSKAISVSGLWQRPSRAWSCLMIAPGAGAGMEHPFMAEMAAELDALGIATLRYQFPYMERGGRRPDPPALCHATVRAAAQVCASLARGLPRFAGGKSFGGRMTSQAQAANPLDGIRGLAFIGFPLHPPGKPSAERGAHLDDVRVPMLFLQGTRDEFATLSLLQALMIRLGSRATLGLFKDANHSFHAPARTGRSDAQIRAEQAVTLAKWMKAVLD
jgi:predicted alpha/beta-hydrolase family hydrolase